MSRAGRLGRFSQWISKDIPRKHSNSYNEWVQKNNNKYLCF